MKRIVVGVDGSPQAARALEWAIGLAKPMAAEVVAVFAISPPSMLEYSSAYTSAPPPEFDPQWRAAIQQEFEHVWCRPLRKSGLPHRLVVEDGRPADVLAALAEREVADLVVVGRRGRGSVAELFLGSVSHTLTHHCHLPVALVPYSRHGSEKGIRMTPLDLPTRARPPIGRWTP